MQKVGQICECCREHWREQNLEPRILKRVGTTKNQKIIVPICDFCDGDLILGIYERNK